VGGQIGCRCLNLLVPNPSLRSWFLHFHSIAILKRLVFSFLIHGKENYRICWKIAGTKYRLSWRWTRSSVKQKQKYRMTGHNNILKQHASSKCKLNPSGKKIVQTLRKHKKNNTIVSSRRNRKKPKSTKFTRITKNSRSHNYAFRRP
jgi:hypothetical protein